MEELEDKPSTPFESDIMSNVDGIFTLSQRNLKQMKQMIDKMKSKVLENEREVSTLMCRINNLYERLNVELNEQDDFISSLPSSAPSKIKVLQREEDRLLAIKKENLSKYIIEVRKEVKLWWEKCYVSEEDRDKFSACFDNEVSDEILDILEAELSRLRKYYEEIEEILTKLDKRQSLWKKVMELEEKANDPDRLFGNRGCTLLLEEKERKKVNHELPKIETELENLVLEYESRNKKPFKACGHILSDFIQAQWEEYHKLKEKERKDRIESKSKTLKIESKMGSLPRENKRKMSNRNNTMSSKMKKTRNDKTIENICSPMSRKSLKKSVLKSPGLTPLSERPGTSRFSPYRNALKEHNRNSPMRRNEKNSNDISSYSQFSVSRLSIFLS